MKLDSPDLLILKYRLLGNSIPPRPIRAKIPGWAGDVSKRQNGATPQPWHCQPFMEGAMYGYELIYPFDTACEVTSDGSKVNFAGNFDNEKWPGTVWPPFETTNPGHYSLASLVDLKVPNDYSLRVEPHPQFFNDHTGNFPVAVIGNIQTSWWPMFLFVTFKAPRVGEVHLFEKGTAYAQLIVVPTKQKIELTEMSEDESDIREKSAQELLKTRRLCPQNQWVSPDGLSFDDTYRRLQKSTNKD